MDPQLLWKVIWIRRGSMFVVMLYSKKILNKNIPIFKWVDWWEQTYFFFFFYIFDPAHPTYLNVEFDLTLELPRGPPGVPMMFFIDPMWPGLFYKQPCHYFIHSLIELVILCLRHHKSKALWAREMTFWENVHPPLCVTFYVSHLRCHMSGNTFQVRQPKTNVYWRLKEE